MYLEPKWQQEWKGSEDGPSGTQRFVLIGTNDHVAAKAFCQAELPLTSEDGIPRGNIGITQTGPYLFDVDVDYGFKRPGEQQKKEVGHSERTFEIGIQEQHVTQSKGTQSHFQGVPFLPPPDFKGAINVTRDGVQGVGINVPTFSWNEKHIFTLAKFNSDEFFQAIWTVAKSPVNSGNFRRFKSGEVLFFGCSGSQRDEETAEITFRFMGSENFTNLTVGEISGIAKEGWQYAWTLYEEEHDTDAKFLVRVPKAVYVETLYSKSDYANLGIGTS